MTVIFVSSLISSLVRFKWTFASRTCRHLIPSSMTSVWALLVWRLVIIRAIELFVLSIIALYGPAL